MLSRILKVRKLFGPRLRTNSTTASTALEARMLWVRFQQPLSLVLGAVCSIW